MKKKNTQKLDWYSQGICGHWRIILFYGKIIKQAFCMLRNKMVFPNGIDSF